MVTQYLLDTNVCVEGLRGKPTAVQWLTRVGLAACAISEITLAELYYGAANAASPHQARRHQAVNAFLEVVAVLSIRPALQMFGEEKTRLRRAGTPVEDFDLLIGCTAKAHQLPVVTGNRRHFERIAEVDLSDWLAE